MPWYRSLRNLDIGIKAGDVFPVERLGARKCHRLAEMGIISRISPPPLSVLPGWEERSALLEEMDAESFLDAPDEQLAQKLDIETGAVTALKWEVIGWITFR